MPKSSKSRKKSAPYRFKRLPDFIEDAWYYGGKNASIHIVLKEQEITIPISEMAVIKTKIRIPQIDLFKEIQ